MAQTAVIAVGDIDIVIGPFLSLVNCIATTPRARSPASVSEPCPAPPDIA
jgi:hypothetical protein